ncbi:MAG: alpha/beta hydrolase [Spongiibacteraceae bacterium]
MSVVPEEFVCDVAGVAIAGKRWRNGTRRVIALHGWLDNAASFDVIAPLLNADIVAIDMAGHGLSYHRTPQASYNVWEDLPDIVRLADVLQWPTFDVIGHSRGAIISALVATALPERVTSAVLLDGLRPNPVSDTDFAEQLGIFLREHLAPPRPATIYDSIEKAIKVRSRAGDMSEVSAALIAQRGLAESPTHKGWCWRHDPRLRFASAVKMTQANIDSVMNKLARMPHRVYFTEGGLGAVLKAHGELDRWLRELNSEMLPGRHHFHMEEQASDLAAKINAFWRERSS